MSVFERIDRDDAWVLEMSALEEGSSLDVGGMYGRMAAAETTTGRRSLAKFVELSRRSLGQSLEYLAATAEVDLGELLSVETGKGIIHSETINRLAKFLKVNPDPLLRLAGLLPTENRQLGQAALHFAARAESVKPLEPQEQEALEKFREEALAVKS